jgi:hypothetical protein
MLKTGMNKTVLMPKWKRPLVVTRGGAFKHPVELGPVGAMYRHDDPRNTYRYSEITGVQDEVLGEELVVEGVLSITPNGNTIYKQTVADVDSYFQGDNADASATSVREVLSGTPIGTKYLTSLYDLSGNKNHWTFDTDVEQPLHDPAAILTDGATQFGEVTIPEYLPNVQSNDDSVAVIADEQAGTTTLRIGKDADGNFEPDTFKHLTAYKQPLPTARQASLEAWESYIITPTLTIFKGVDGEFILDRENYFIGEEYGS